MTAETQMIFAAAALMRATQKALAAPPKASPVCVDCEREAETTCRRCGDPICDDTQCDGPGYYWSRISGLCGQCTELVRSSNENR